ncbi:MAG: hypothetical protein ACYC25_17265 [Paludibacter sp.]
MNNNNISKIVWTFHDGIQRHEFTSFPYAFRAMYNTIKRGADQGKTQDSMTRAFKIISPFGEYTYVNASRLAREQGLLLPDGSLNTREFKRK